MSVGTGSHQIRLEIAHIVETQYTVHVMSSFEFGDRRWLLCGTCAEALFSAIRDWEVAEQRGRNVEYEERWMQRILSAQRAGTGIGSSAQGTMSVLAAFVSSWWNSASRIRRSNTERNEATQRGEPQRSVGLQKQRIQNPGGLDGQTLDQSHRADHRHCDQEVKVVVKEE